MKTLILDGSHAGDPRFEKINRPLRLRLPDAETIVVRDQKIGNRAGDFFCRVRYPGLCNVEDDNPLIAGKIVESDLLIYLM